MNKDSLIVKLMREKGWSLEEADEFVADMPDEPEPRPVSRGESEALARPRLAWEAGDTVEVRKGDQSVAPRRIVAQRGADGLTASQRAGLDRGIPLCLNCQEPENNHLPGCARAGENPMDKKATTKAQLPPSA